VPPGCGLADCEGKPGKHGQPKTAELEQSPKIARIASVAYVFGSEYSNEKTAGEQLVLAGRLMSNLRPAK
jgi:hypothetical protein